MRQGGEVVYQRLAPGTAHADPAFGAQRTHVYFGQPLDVEIWPAARTRAVFLSRLPDSLLVVGTAIALLFAMVLRYYALARSQARGAEATLRRLEHEAHERELVQETLEQAHEALKQRNQELQDFASVAAHDLQEPLRKILSFADRVQTKSADELKPETVDYLTRIQSSAQRMRVLINDLLTYSRVTTTAQPFVPVDLTQILSDVAYDLEVRLEQSG
jgi:signal transduction histidine kinase